MSSVFCRRCKYALTGLAAGCCPECGRTFDPQDPSTFSVTAALRRRWVVWVVSIAAAYPILFHAYVLFLYCVGRVVLGRWPIEMADDPRGVPIVSTLYKHDEVLFGPLFFTVFVVIVGAFFLPRGWRLVFGCGGVWLWIVSFYVLWLSPVMGWYLD
jgi:hypothetical protein